MKLPIGSYSFYNQFENCPHKAFQLYVAKAIPYVETPEMKWGNDVHSAVENRIKRGSPLPDTMRAAEQAAAEFHKMATMLPFFTEYQLAMTDKGQPCDYWADNVFFRGKLDFVLMNTARSFAWMVDWKTGNVREDAFELETGALLLQVNWPDLAEIKGEYFWMKTGQNGLRYTIKDFSAIWVRLHNLRAEAESYLRAGEWPKRKTPLCGWCDVTSCEHNTKHKRV